MESDLRFSIVCTVRTFKTAFLELSLVTSPGKLRRTALMARIADRATGTTRPSQTTGGWQGEREKGMEGGEERKIREGEGLEEEGRERKGKEENCKIRGSCRNVKKDVSKIYTITE
jgi:hypothetical protein